MPDGRHNERPVEVAIEPLATALRDEEAPVACRPLEKPFGLILLWRMGRADWIVRAEAAHVERGLQVSSELPSLLDEPPERALRPGGSRREQDRRHRGGIAMRRTAVDTLSEGARCVPALQADGRHEQVGERVQHVEPHPWERRRSLPGLRIDERPAPGFVAGQELLPPLQDRRLFLPRTDRVLVEPDEDPLAAELGGRQPVRREPESGRLHAEVVLPLEVGAHGLEAGEADLREDPPAPWTDGEMSGDPGAGGLPAP